MPSKFFGDPSWPFMIDFKNRDGSIHRYYTTAETVYRLEALYGPNHRYVKTHSPSL